MASIGKNIRTLRENAGMSQDQLGERIGKTRSAVSQYESDKIVPRMGVIEEIAHVFDVSKSELIGEARSRGFLPVPLYGRVAAGTPLEMLPVDETREAPARFVDDDPECFLVKVRGDSMSRAIPDGCFALVSPKYTEPEPSGMYLVTVNGDDATIKRVRRLANGIELVPDSYDPTYRSKAFDFADEYAPPVKVIGRVVWWCAEF